ncbi:hypothetical protein SDC9_137257 [bioreactor metagenome]|uniref:Uncharacterized protein n=1 Tax=bioreactor metagenome TaxID=1076179 RepID=A0A645DL18_9ZZZZ
MTVARNTLDLPKKVLIVSGGIKVSIKPMRNNIPIRSPKSPPIMPFAILVEFRVFFLSLNKKNKNRPAVMSHNDKVNMSSLGNFIGQPPILIICLML